MAEWLTKIWCQLTHGGGDIKRDPSGLINWQCRQCGRWSDPVSREDEQRVIDRDLIAFENKYACSRCGGTGEEPEAGRKDLS